MPGLPAEVPYKTVCCFFLSLSCVVGFFFFFRRFIYSVCALYCFPERSLKKILNNLQKLSIPIWLYKKHTLLGIIFLIKVYTWVLYGSFRDLCICFCSCSSFPCWNVIQYQVIYLQKTISTLLQQCNFSQANCYFFPKRWNFTKLINADVWY